MSLTHSAKRRIAIEFLLFLGPLVLVAVLSIAYLLYLSEKRAALRQKKAPIADEVQYSIDSLRQSDLDEFKLVVQRMKADRMAQSRIDGVRNFVENKKYSFRMLSYVTGDDVAAFTALTNIYGDTLRTKSLTKLQLYETEMLKLDQEVDWLVGSEGYNGAVAITYFVILILLYPVRFLVLAVKWSIRALKEPAVK